MMLVKLIIIPKKSYLSKKNSKNKDMKNIYVLKNLFGDFYQLIIL